MSPLFLFQLFLWVNCIFRNKYIHWKAARITEPWAKFECRRGIRKSAGWDWFSLEIIWRPLLQAVKCSKMVHYSNEERVDVVLCNFLIATALLQSLPTGSRLGEPKGDLCFLDVKFVIKDNDVIFKSLVHRCSSGPVTCRRWEIYRML